MKRYIVLLALLISAGLGKEVVSCLDSTQEAWFYGKFTISWIVIISDEGYQKESEEDEADYWYSKVDLSRRKDIRDVITQVGNRRINIIRQELLKEGKCKKVKL